MSELIELHNTTCGKAMKQTNDSESKHRRCRCCSHRHAPRVGAVQHPETSASTGPSNLSPRARRYCGSPPLVMTAGRADMNDATDMPAQAQARRRESRPEPVIVPERPAAAPRRVAEPTAPPPDGRDSVPRSLGAIVRPCGIHCLSLWRPDTCSPRMARPCTRGRRACPLPI